ncbi:MAG: ABC transporter ATP-binding protein [Tissierellia bacterium]|nr:ABC transporter ATP-binding protein [Tissierellia bacterium]
MSIVDSAHNRYAACLKVEDLSKSWGDHKVFSDISFEQPSGTIYGISGANGSGKSTLLKILASVLPRDKGRITFGSVSVDDHRAWRSMIGYVPQELALDGRLTVRENIKYWSALRGIPSSQIQHNLEVAKRDPLVSDFLDKQIRKCSGGMARRASMVIGLLGAPAILLLDEPFAGADEASQEIMIRQLEILKKDNRCILVTSHEFATLERISDKILYLNQGKLTM